MPQYMYMENEFGDKFQWYVLGGNVPGVTPIANGTVVANISGSTGLPTATALQSFSNKAPAKAGVTAIAAESAQGAITVTTAGGNTYADAAINTALASVVTGLNAVITQANAILAALKVVS